MKVDKEINTTMTTNVKLQIMAKVETNIVTPSKSCNVLGAKANLIELLTAKEELELGCHKIAKLMFNSEVNLVSDWVLEHKPKKLSNKRYKRRKKVP